MPSKWKVLRSSPVLEKCIVVWEDFFSPSKLLNNVYKNEYISKQKAKCWVLVSGLGWEWIRC